jgi:type 1 glutamine amidotransferase
MRILALTGGHRVDLAAFTAMLAAVCDERGWVFAHAEQPAAQRWLAPEHRGAFDAVLCHDLPGLALRRGTPPTAVGPDAATARNLIDLLDAGQGVVFLHHALAGWPGWPGWAEVLGGRFHYAPATLRGADWPDSGFQHVDYTARVVAPEHPVCAGLRDFPLHDELYNCPVFADDVTPLLRANPLPASYRATYAEVLGEPAGDWRHPAPSDLIAWAKPAGRSPVVYVQPGDGPETFGSSAFRHLIGNALAWVASPEAAAWAREHATKITEPAPQPTEHP